uniref:Uncharacterized protein n=1 Tax=Oryza meridionalis TaxID=40149 RepID=A0A0E0EYS2_9ORYZ
MWCEPPPPLTPTPPPRGPPSGAWHDGNTAFLHSLKKPESWLHLVNGGNGGRQSMVILNLSSIHTLSNPITTESTS